MLSNEFIRVHYKGANYLAVLQNSLVIRANDCGDGLLYVREIKAHSLLSDGCHFNANKKHCLSPP